MFLTCHNDRNPDSEYEQRATEASEQHPILNEFS